MSGWWIFIIGVIVGVLLVWIGGKLGEIYKKLLSVRYLHFGIAFKDDPKEIEDNNKELKP
jgi:hypothetical protein